MQATGGTLEGNADLAGQIGGQVEGAMRGVVLDELRKAGRPGGFFDHARRQILADGMTICAC